MKATTLMELLVAAVISTIVLTGVVTYITTSNQVNEAIIMQTKAHAILSLAGRVIEDKIKAGSTLRVSTSGDTLRVFDQDNIQTARFTIAGQKLLIKEGTNTEKEIISFANASFEGSFYEKYEGRFSSYQLKLILVDGKRTFATSPMVFNAKCRNAKMLTDE